MDRNFRAVSPLLTRCQLNRSSLNDCCIARWNTEGDAKLLLSKAKGISFWQVCNLENKAQYVKQMVSDEAAFNQYVWKQKV
jgi:hypothetical protein